MGRRQQICSEQIEIETSEDSLADLPSVLLPLVVPDLPAVLWCKSEKAAGLPAFKRLTALAPRVILDIGGFSEPNRALEEWTREPLSVITTDLSWARLTRWRETVAQVFDNAVCASRLSRLSRMTISYWGELESDIPLSAFLLAGWLVNCLDWGWTGATPSNNGAKRLAFTNESAAARLSFAYAGDNGSGNRLASVTLASEDEHDAQVALERDGDYLDIRIATGETEPTGTPRPLPRRKRRRSAQRRAAHLHPRPTVRSRFQQRRQDRRLNCGLRGCEKIGDSSQNPPSSVQRWTAL